MNKIKKQTQSFALQSSIQAGWCPVAEETIDACSQNRVGACETIGVAIGRGCQSPIPANIKAKAENSIPHTWYS